MDWSAWNLAVIQWKRSDGSVGWFNAYLSETTMTVKVAPNRMNFIYLNGNASRTFSFIVASNLIVGKRDIATV